MTYNLMLSFLTPVQAVENDRALLHCTCQGVQWRHLGMLLCGQDWNAVKLGMLSDISHMSQNSV